MIIAPTISTICIRHGEKILRYVSKSLVNYRTAVTPNRRNPRDSAYLTQ